MQKHTIELKNVSFEYEKNQPVFQSLSVLIDSGEFAVIFGGNGQGKSTLLKLMLGLLKPTQGEIRFGEKTPQLAERLGEVAYIPQRATAFNSAFPATVQELVASGFVKKRRRLRPLSAQQKEKMHEALKNVGLAGFEKRLIGELSGGQQQRAFLARSLVDDCRYLFLDEATSGIDMPSATAICCLLAEINRNQKKTMVMVTHDIESVRAHASRVLYVSPDHQVMDFSPDAFDHYLDTHAKHILRNHVASM